MSENKFEFCQFGAGRIGAIHAGNIAASDRASLRYVVDIDQRAAADLTVPPSQMSPPGRSG